MRSASNNQRQRDGGEPHPHHVLRKALNEVKGEELMTDKSQFVYVTYISTTPKMLWSALIDPKITKKYWQHKHVSDWKPGSKWEHRSSDKERTLKLVGKVIESSLPRRLVLT
ncbi:MAG: SRPBCC domain-containing protein [Syntrophales bacterium]